MSEIPTSRRLFAQQAEQVASLTLVLASFLLLISSVITRDSRLENSIAPMLLLSLSAIFAPLSLARPTATNRTLLAAVTLFSVGIVGWRVLSLGTEDQLPHFLPRLSFSLLVASITVQALVRGEQVGATALRPLARNLFLLGISLSVVAVVASSLLLHQAQAIKASIAQSSLDTEEFYRLMSTKEASLGGARGAIFLGLPVLLFPVGTCAWLARPFAPCEHDGPPRAVLALVVLAALSLQLMALFRADRWMKDEREGIYERDAGHSAPLHTVPRLLLRLREDHQPPKGFGWTERRYAQRAFFSTSSSLLRAS